jgi:PEP-CTERM motif
LGHKKKGITMKRALQIASLAGIILLVSVGAASADTLHYLVTGPLGGISGSFDLLRNPTFTSVTPGTDFIVTVNNGSINFLGHSYPAPPFNLEFWDVSKGGGFGLYLGPILGGLQLKGDLMFNGYYSAPALYAGIFHLDSGLVTVTVTRTPEPSTLLLLGSALVSLGLFRKRRTSN